MARRKQAGIVPVRRSKGDLRFLLVTSSRGKWIFPKGKIEQGESPREAAEKEGMEEAGVSGKVSAKLGTYREKKGPCTMFLMEESDTRKGWLEQKRRKRRWVSYRKARRLLGKKGHRRALDRARALIAER